MRKTLALLGALALVGSLAWAMGARYSSGINGISVTATNTNTSFVDNHSGGASAAFRARSVSICSRATSANTCHFDLDGVATTADWSVIPGQCVSLGFSDAGGGSGWTAIGTICAAAETATFDIAAGR